MSLIEVNGVAIGCDDTGSGPVLIATHSGLADRREWDRLVGALAPACRVVVWDARGHGESDAAGGAVAHHDDLIGLMDTLEINDAALVGSGEGAGTALDVAAVAPERVTGLVLCNPVPTGWSPTASLDGVPAGAVPDAALRRYAAGGTIPDLNHLRDAAEAHARRWVAGVGRSDDDLDGTTWALALEMARQVLWRRWTSQPAVRFGPEPPTLARLAEVVVPTAVRWGDHDDPEIADMGARIAAGAGTATGGAVPATGRLMAMESPGAVAAAVAGLWA